MSYCRQIGALPILVAPPGNDAGFEPNRSILPPETPRAEREAFARAFQEARAREQTDPAGSIAAYRALIERQPGFAESHFRLARLLEARGDYEEAYRHYIEARDLDGHPFRCLTSFQDVYRELASEYEAILVDGQARLSRPSPAWNARRLPVQRRVSSVAGGPCRAGRGHPRRAPGAGGLWLARDRAGSRGST